MISSDKQVRLDFKVTICYDWHHILTYNDVNRGTDNLVSFSKPSKTIIFVVTEGFIDCC